MKKATLTFLVCWLGAFSPAVLAGDNRPFDRAQRAMQQKDYKAAITLCLGMLEQAPGDYDVNFLLAQAYSRSGDRERAMAVLGKMETQFPKNSDIIIFVARIHAWKGHYGEAMARYQEVLEFAPGNEEALVGTADIAARQKNHARAFSILQQVIERNPGNADAYYHLGLVHQWEGNTGKAKENFEKAAALDPGNEDYRVILTRASPRLQRKDEIRYGHEVEDWSDGRRDFQNDRLALHLELPRQAGVLILRYQQTHRFGETDRQFGLEAYPRLWRKAYGRFDLGFAPRSNVYPRLSYLAEVYQGLFAAAEASLGVWRMNFPDRPVTVALGSLGYYLGNYYPYVRANYCRENGNTSISWVLNVRRYFSAENFIYAGYGSGTRLLDDLTIQDLLPDRSDIYLAGVTWYVFDKIRIEFHFSRIRGNSLSRTTFQLSTGYRWR